MIDDWRQKNEVMDKVLKELSVPSKWVYDNKILYKHLDSDLSITWGYESSYGDGGNVYRIESPVCIRIPFRYRSKFEIYINQIGNRHTNDSMSFLNEYLDGEYIIGIKIDSNNRSEAAMWLEEQGIHDWYMSYSKIWFKKEEDVMAYKLRWG